MLHSISCAREKQLEENEKGPWSVSMHLIVQLYSYLFGQILNQIISFLSSFFDQ